VNSAYSDKDQLSPPVSLRLARVLLLFLYPFVLLADLMSLAGESSGRVSMMQTVVMYAFIFGTLAYPVVYLICYVIWRDRRNSGREASTLVCAFPLAYLLVPVLTVGVIGYSKQRQANRAIAPANPSSLPTSQPY
jgi:hypothetical protein